MALTTCPDCSNRVSTEAPACPHCGRPLKANASTSQEPARAAAEEPQKQQYEWTAGRTGCALAIVVGLVIFVISLFSGNSPLPSGTSATAPAAPRNTRAPAQVASGPQLQLLSKRGTIGEYGYSFVEGQVKNITDKPMEHVEAVVTWYTSSGDFISSDSALIEYDPLLPGQTSPFKVGSRTNPEMKRFGLEFKFLMGGTIQTSEQ